MIAVFAVVTIAAGPSYAAEGDRVVQGTLLNTANDNEPVPGVTINVTSSDGGSYTAKSDADGKFKITVPAKDTGTLTVQLDTSTLPKGVDLRAGSSDTRTPTGSLSNIVVSFPIGADQRQVETKLDQIPQSIYNGLLFGIVLSLGALGLSMIFGTTGLTNFAHGELVTFGAIVAYLGRPAAGPPDRRCRSWSPSSIVAPALRLAQRQRLLETTARRGTGLIAVMIVSIGLRIFLCATSTCTVTGGARRTYRESRTPKPHRRSGPSTAPPRRDPGRDRAAGAGGRDPRAAADPARQGDPRGRRTTRRSPRRPASTSTAVIRMVWIVGGALAGLAGILLGLAQGVNYQWRSRSCC